MLTFTAEYSPPHDETLVFVQSSADAASGSALIAAFSSKAAAAELADFLNFLATGYARFKIERVEPANTIQQSDPDCA